MNTVYTFFVGFGKQLFKGDLIVSEENTLYGLHSGPRTSNKGRTNNGGPRSLNVKAGYNKAFLAEALATENDMKRSERVRNKKAVNLNGAAASFKEPINASLSGTYSYVPDESVKRQEQRTLLLFPASPGRREEDLFSETYRIHFWELLHCSLEAKVVIGETVVFEKSEKPAVLLFGLLKPDGWVLAKKNELERLQTIQDLALGHNSQYLLDLSLPFVTEPERSHVSDGGATTK
ncbi:hypothetical protein E5288_WYG015075 [Bos mutus]|uniref:Uncharacterized protein n=1 Tax=Bos mutus TaxID=72004 RepID=A0A6B0RG95_9CETA|nr:hypothetical protein [Bos mutus]